MMPRTLGSPRHQLVCEFLIAARKRARLTQAAVAHKLGRHQSFVATVEAGQRRIDVVELLDLAEAIGFDPNSLIKRLRRVPRD